MCYTEDEYILLICTLTWILFRSGKFENVNFHLQLYLLHISSFQVRNLSVVAVVSFTCVVFNNLYLLAFFPSSYLLYIIVWSMLNPNCGMPFEVWQSDN